MRTSARIAVVAAAVVVIFAVPAVVSRLAPAPAPCGPVVTPATYGSPEVRR